ncbi:hypothetical protein [Sporosalibacterium faouarense]|uniref:hypothetical protein n=1 Tax=Sporosalibacterium faouarense TaxID=516123 RepID=UPI00141C8AAF|nr:hypothetical protein [Sporosalibacterium faouarense]MTI49656.1 hypothetical protein [Bacillota bacterium]
MIDKQIKYSLERHKLISIIYMKGMEIIQRKIQVLKIEANYIKALDIDKGAIRTFKIENILSAIGVKDICNKENKSDNIMI